GRRRSSSPTPPDSRASATTTGRGRSGATRCGRPSRGERWPDGRIVSDDKTMTSPLDEIAADFRDVTPPDRLQLLLEFSDELPDLPTRYADAPEQLEQVHECQTPLFLAVEVGADPGVSTGNQRVSLFFSAPREAPTTRGFAGILHEGL